MMILLRSNCFKCGKRLPHVEILSKRYKSKYHWSDYENKNFPRYKALEHFDDFYKSVFGDKLWRSLRLGLLCNNKYCAVVNNYCDPEKTIRQLEVGIQNRGAQNLRQLFEIELHKQSIEDSETREQKTKRSIERMEDKMVEVIAQKERGDRISSAFSKYEKATPITEERINIPEEVEEPPPKDHYEKKSLFEGMKEAHIDHSRIIHPNNPLSAATLYEFVPATKIKGLDDWIGESKYYDYYKKTLDFPIKIEKETQLNFPKHLNVFMYEKCDVTSFPHPKAGGTGVLDFYLMDGASILPILALDLELGDRVLDMCGAPGGKSLTAFQTLLPDQLVCNDVNAQRVRRIEKVVSEYLYSLSSQRKFEVTHCDGLKIKTKNYNKILVDVPCTNDRVSVNQDENSYFLPNKVKDRLQLPDMQSDLLAHALKIVEPGGSVVYSTCSLSPVQNDGVIQMALQKVWEETDSKFLVKDMTEAFRPINIAYCMGTNVGLKYGLLVLPHLTANCGPLYFSKLEKLC